MTWKYLATMVIVNPLTGVIPLPNGRTSWLISGGVTNHLLTGMIQQVSRIQKRWSLLTSTDGDLTFFEKQSQPTQPIYEPRKKKRPDTASMKYWWFNRDPYNGLL